MMTNEEINEALTVKLFGKCWHDVEIVEDEDEEMEVCKKCRSRIFFDEQTNQNYCGSIDKAWKVVEKITEVPKTIEAARRAVNTKFYYKFIQIAGDLACSNSSEAAEMICRAALKAIEQND